MKRWWIVLLTLCLLPCWAGAETLEITLLSVDPDPTMATPWTEVGGEIPADQMPTTMDCKTDRETYYPCPVTWEDFSAVDMTTPGKYDVVGTLLPEPGYVLPEDLESSITCSLLVAGEGGETIPLIMTDLTNTEDAVLAIGDDIPELSDLFFRCEDVFMNRYMVPISQWDMGGLDTAKKGAYTLTATPALPANFTTLEPPRQTKTIFVVDPTCVDLSAYHLTVQGGFLGEVPIVQCKWLYAPPSPVTVELAIGQGDWEPCDSNLYQLYGTSFTVFLALLEEKTDYYFRLHLGDTTTESLHIYLKEDIPELEVGNLGGNRDGDDTDGDDMPTLTQPVHRPSSRRPSSSLPTVSKPEPVEIVTDTATTLSAYRLEQLAEENDSIFFEKQGLSLSFSGAYLCSLLDHDDDLLTVTLMPTEDGFSLSLEADGDIILDFPQTSLFLPWVENTPLPTCFGEDGETPLPLTYVGNNLATVSLCQSGEFHFVAPAESVPEPEEPDVVTPESEAIAPEPEEPEVTAPVISAKPQPSIAETTKPVVPPQEESAENPEKEPIDEPLVEPEETPGEAILELPQMETVAHPATEAMEPAQPEPTEPINPQETVPPPSPPQTPQLGKKSDFPVWMITIVFVSVGGLGLWLIRRGRRD